MSVIVNILDALRKFGSSTQKSAILRQDAQLEGQEVLERKVEQVRTELGTAETYVATTRTQPEETIEPLSEAVIAGIRANAAKAASFVSTFIESNASIWSIDDLDAAFKAWTISSEKHGFNPNTVIELLGAAFGERCAQELNMQWINVTDKYGKSIALVGKEKAFRAYPYDSIAKRVAEGECDFFKPIFMSLLSASRNEDIAPTASA
jgi:hypothetical protein